ncbi:MAG: trimeric intracellular cation channel family protein [Bacteroidales bacterium]|nr:trimeric intracellular cation channel family protein [Bacteroidales bacterium]MDD6140742.1 trimeric intracellular cation channel family protein [Bacteroidales bacterium]MDD6669341.1 trimeric intracellular cation channel family protein [Bacteroidales bacterium]
MEATISLILEIIGTIAFAISGIKLAAAKKFDWFGAYIVGLMTAIGGGTLRDILLDTTPFWMVNGWYLTVTGLSLLYVILFRRQLERMSSTILIFDTIGLALFVVIGIQKTLTFDYPMWVAIIMGTLTGAFGGVVRDILLNDVPLIFRKDIYGTACIAGGIVYWLMIVCDAEPLLQQLSCAFTVIIIRLLAVKYNWAIPVLRNND